MTHTSAETEKAIGYSKRLFFFILIVLSILALTACTACGNGWIREKGERGALAYYQNKYGGDAEIVSAREWGNTTAILPTKINRMVFEMSDGNVVLWDCETQQYADTRQAEEILTQLREQLVQPATEESLGTEILISDYTATAAVFEDYTASRGVSAFTSYYDGDIYAFAETEKPLLMDYNVVVRESTDEDENGTAFKAQAEALRQKLQPFFSGADNRIYVLSRDYTGELVQARQIYSPEGNWLVRGVGRIDFDDTVHWIENIYIETMPGVWMTSNEEDFVLLLGDLVLEQVGTGADLQKILDARYEALPIVAEKNKDGIYRVPDKQHCSKTVVKDLDAPVYRILWSDRARAAQDEYGRLDVCIYLEPEMAEAADRLWYFPESDEDEFEMYPVMTETARPDTGVYGDLTEGALYCFGDVGHEE